MGTLLSQLKVDSKMIVQSGGFENDVVVSHGGDSYSTKGLTPAHHTRIDPDSYTEVSGEKASVTLHVDDMIAAGFITSDNLKNMKGYCVAFTDNNGEWRAYAVSESRPDYSFSTVTLLLGKVVGYGS